MREMKDSGISWVGEIPKEWSVNRAKYCFVNTKEIAGCRSDRYERLALTMNGVIKRSKDDSNGLQPEKFETYQILRPDELVFKLIDLQNVSTSRVGLSPYLGLVSPAYIILKSNKRVLPAFAEKYFLMLWKNQIFNALGDAGVRSNLNSKDLLELSIPFPSLDEQQRIAEFLDRECGKIDGLKADIQAQIDTLEQYKRSVITEAVTHGLNPSAPMKECSVSWARQIPQHWKVMPNKHLMTKIKNICPIYKGEDILSLTMYGVIVRDLDAGGKMPSSFDGYQYEKCSSLDEMYEETGFEPADDTPSPEEQFFENERKKAIKQLVSKAMQELTEKQRIVVYKTFWEEKTLRQVGLELGIDNKTVYEILEAAKGKMKKFLKFF